MEEIRRIAGLGAAALGLGALIFLGGCASSKAGEPPTGTASKSGSQLWAESCLHCHTSRSPSAYSDGEWDVVMLHMRLRGNLTGEEQRKIVEFLKASN